MFKYLINKLSFRNIVSRAIQQNIFILGKSPLVILHSQPIREDSFLNLLVPLCDPPRGADVPVNLSEVLAVLSGLLLGCHDAVASVEVHEVLAAPRGSVPLGEAGVKWGLFVIVHFLLHRFTAHYVVYLI